MPQLYLKSCYRRWKISSFVLYKKKTKRSNSFFNRSFQQTGNLYSHENTFVAVDPEGNVMGSLTGYNGDHFIALRQPILELIQKQYANDLIPEPETVGQEFYIDSVAVSTAARGQGVGTELLKHAIKHAKNEDFKQIGLLVDLDNPNAKKLYERLGFTLGNKMPFVGGEYYHMYIQFV
ncbi:GNAT family N-acetyltransferase [Sphingobacterium sp. E70]|uniref:GNAT family N-acetyltransferase n=1 Tax=Sphingobacterium sp. E70 TaxID=2853439 RepID=UPI00211C36C5|nr:GNAT family N-acetyltransferase [Sphingobacterium sp. E70]ULT23231.1 GNAT family N-acetyltransferase [Sphingobacterium sp. E70]